MCGKIMIDANIIAEYQKERVNEIIGPYTESINYILKNSIIIMDDGDLILTEWMETCSFSSHVDDLLSNWVMDQIIAGAIELLPVNNCKELSSKRKKLRQSGLQGKDTKYPCLSYRNNIHSFVTNDIDFYEPSAKGRADRESMVHEMKGSMRGLIKTEFGLEVFPAVHTIECLPKCPARE